MSSATPWKVDEVGKAIRGAGGPTNQLSYRQQTLDHYWRYFRCSNYEGRKFDWHGNESMGLVETDAVARSGAIPPGFYDAGGGMIPLKFRKPSTPYYLGKVVVHRFTSLLFSSSRHPKIEADDPVTADWLNGFAEATRLWAHMIRVRTYGGAMGSVGLGFKFVRGKPHVEVHDPRWCTPVFEDRDLLILSSMEKLYQFPETVKNSEGEWEEQWFWYRRLITKTHDVVWPKVPVDEEGAQPNWERERCVSVEHNLGECPVVWIQNQPVEDDTDGDPDCHGCFELIERIDALYSQADRGTIANCDPSVIVTSDAEFDNIQKGTGNALQVEKGGTVQYMEMNGTGTKAAVELAEKLEEKALVVARCMLDNNQGGPSRSVAEVEHNYSSMIEQADIYREQYGEKGVKRLLEMVLAAARKLGAPRVDRSDPNLPRISKAAITLPKKKVIDPETGAIKGWVERQLGEGSQLELSWPQYFTPSLEVISKSVEASVAAKNGGIIDLEHAVAFIASHFQVENAAEMIKNIQAQQESGALPDPAQSAVARAARF